MIDELFFFPVKIDCRNVDNRVLSSFELNFQFISKSTTKYSIIVSKIHRVSIIADITFRYNETSSPRKSIISQLNILSKNSAMQTQRKIKRDESQALKLSFTIEKNQQLRSNQRYLRNKEERTIILPRKRSNLTMQYPDNS